MMHTYTPQPMSLLGVNLLHLTEFKSLDKILKLMVNMTRSNQNHTMTLQPTPPANVLSKFQLLTTDGF